MTSPIHQLRQLRDALQSQLNSNELFVAWMEANEAVNRAEMRLAAVIAGEARNSASPHDGPMPDMVRRRNIVDVALSYIAEHNRPISSRDLLRLAHVPEEKEGTARSQLSKDERVESIQIGPSSKLDKAWWLKGRPLPSGVQKYVLQSNAAPPAGAGEAESNPGAGLTHQ